MTPTIKVIAVPGWACAPERAPDSGHAYVRRTTESVLEVSYAGAWSGAAPPTDRDLVNMARGFAMALEDPKLVTTDRGSCYAGRFGSATFQAAGVPFAQSWCLSNGVDIVRITHVCSYAPELDEMFEVQWMVMTMQLEPA